MKKTLLLVVAIGAVLAIFYFLNKKEAIAPVVVPPATTNTKTNTNPVVTDTGQAELCFAKFGVPDQDGLYDKYTLRLELNSGQATGELNFLPAEKDRKTGEIEGTLGAVDKMTEARTADLWWFTFAEGMNVKEELKIILSGSVASVGFGEMVDRGDGVYVYKDTKNIAYTLSLPSVSCADLVERVNVENYLRDNISELSPVQAVLGGTWYVTSVTIDAEKNSGTVAYEDGHIAEKKNFTYTTNKDGEVVSLTIK